MVRYILARLFWMAVTVVLIVTILYISTSMVMLHNFGPRPRLSFLENFMVVWSNFIVFIRNIVTDWHWGYSPRGEEIWDTLMRRAPLTIRVNLIVALIYTTFGLLLGFIAAIKKDTWIDNVISTFIMIFSSIPSFILVFPLVIILGFQLRWVPSQYPDAFFEPTLIRSLKGLVIPVLALSGPAIATLARLVRGELVESLNSDYLLLARVKGLTRKHAVFKHSVRNSLIPILNAMPALFTSVLMTSFFIEPVYGMRGISAWFLRSIVSMVDGGGFFYIRVPDVIIISLFYASFALVGALIVDILYAVVDPRVNMRSKKSITT